MREYIVQFKYAVRESDGHISKRSNHDFRLNCQDLDEVVSGFLFNQIEGGSLSLSSYLGFHLKRRLAKEGKITLVGSVVCEGFGHGYVAFADGCAKKIIEKLKEKK